MLKGGFALPTFLPSLVPVVALLLLQGAELDPSFGRVNFLPSLLHEETRHPELAMGEEVWRPLFSALAFVEQVSQDAKCYPSQKRPSHHK